MNKFNNGTKVYTLADSERIDARVRKMTVGQILLLDMASKADIGNGDVKHMLANPNGYFWNLRKLGLVDVVGKTANSSNYPSNLYRTTDDGDLVLIRAEKLLAPLQEGE